MVVELFTDGGVIRANPSRVGGMFAWITVDRNDEPVSNGFGVIPAEGYVVTNNQMELLAIVEGLKSLDDGWSGKVCSDSQISLGRLLQGHRLKNISEQLKFEMLDQISRMGKMSGELIGGHPTVKELDAGINRKGRRVSKWNVWCDKKCTEIGEEYLANIQKAALNAMGV